MSAETATARELAALVGVTPTAVLHWAKKPCFPRPAGRRTSALKGMPARTWRVDDVAQWLQACAAAIEIAEAERANLDDAIEEARARVAEERRQLLTEIAKRLDAGDTFQAIAADLGRPYWTVRNMARRAGLMSPRRGAPRRHSHEDVIAALHDAAEATDGHLSERAYNLWRATTRPDAPSASSLHSRFGGSWSDVLEAVGLPSQRLENHAGRPSRRWSDEAMLDAIARSGETTLTGYEVWRRTRAEPTPSPSSIIARFGSWSEAIRQATD